MLKILSLGNSFSMNAQHHLGDIAAADGFPLLLGNLVIGGCSLQTHYENLVSGEKKYAYYKTGQECRYESIDVAVNEEDWDIVTLQQASHFSGKSESYYPYLLEIAAYIRKQLPKVEIVMHQTWAYEIDSGHGCFDWYDRDQIKMYQALKSAYAEAAKKLGGVRIIPCGDVIQALRETPTFDYSHGGKSLNLKSDGFHLQEAYGQYAAAAAWYETLCGKSILENTYFPEVDNPEVILPSANELQLIKETVHRFCSK